MHVTWNYNFIYICQCILDVYSICGTKERVIITRITRPTENHLRRQRNNDRTAFSRERNYCTALLNAACDQKLMCRRMSSRSSLIRGIIFSPGFSEREKNVSPLWRSCYFLLPLNILMLPANRTLIKWIVFAYDIGRLNRKL